MSREIIIEQIRAIADKLGPEAMAHALVSERTQEARLKGFRAAKKAAKKARMMKVQRKALGGKE